MSVIQIGRCFGCEKHSRLDEGVCTDCLNDPTKGRKWAMIAREVRQDPKVATKVYSLIKTDDGKRLFIKMFGLPPNCIDPDFVEERSKLSLVR